MLIDDKINAQWKVINGKTKLINNNNKASYDCNFDRLSKCTQDKIDQMNLLEKVICITEGFGCVSSQFVFCGWENCGGEDFAKKYILKSKQQHINFFNL